MNFIHFFKFLTIGCIACIVCSCSNIWRWNSDPEEAAKSLLAEACELVARSATVEEISLSDMYELLLKAESRLDKILMSFQSTTTAKNLTEGSLKINNLTLAEFKTHIEDIKKKMDAQGNLLSYAKLTCANIKYPDLRDESFQKLCRFALKWDDLAAFEEMVALIGNHAVSASVLIDRAEHLLRNEKINEALPLVDAALEKLEMKTDALFEDEVLISESLARSAKILLLSDQADEAIQLNRAISISDIRIENLADIIASLKGGSGKVEISILENSENDPAFKIKLLCREAFYLYDRNQSQEAVQLMERAIEKLKGVPSPRLNMELQIMICRTFGEIAQNQLAGRWYEEIKMNALKTEHRREMYITQEILKLAVKQKDLPFAVTLTQNADASLADENIMFLIDELLAMDDVNSALTLNGKITDDNLRNEAALKTCIKMIRSNKIDAAATLLPNAKQSRNPEVLDLEMIAYWSRNDQLAQASGQAELISETFKSHAYLSIARAFIDAQDKGKTLESLRKCIQYLPDVQEKSQVIGILMELADIYKKNKFRLDEASSATLGSLAN